MEKRTRQELHKQLQDLLAASRAPSSGKLEDDEEPRRSSERRKLSYELVVKSNELPAVRSTEQLPTLANSNDHQKQSFGSEHESWEQPLPNTDAQGQADSCMPWLPFKAIYAALKQHPSIWITSLLVMLLLAAAGIVGVMLIAANETARWRQAADGFAVNAAVSFERQLAQMFMPLLSLATIIRHDPSYAVINATFDAVAAELLSNMPTQGAVTTLILAPQGVLRNFYPMEGYCKDNCGDIHINLFKSPERRPVALRTVKEGRLLMQGPMILSQGYYGVVGRQPVYISPSTADETFGAPDGLAYNCSVCFNATTNTQFWGFVNAVINLDPLLKGSDSRMQDLKAMGYLYRMYKVGDNGTELLIARSTVLPEDPVRTEVRVPGGTWILEVSPEHGWLPVWRAPVMAVVVLISCLFGLLLGAILVSSRLQMWLKSANDALAMEKERMDVLLARQYNLISCVLQQEGEAGHKHDKHSVEHRTLARIEDMRREIGVTNGTNGVDELQLVELIDEGTYGKVFRGVWRGSTVAVKTMVLPAKMSGAEKRERMAIMEAAISSTMNHPNIVQTYTYIIKPCATSVACCPSSEGSFSNAEIASSLEKNLDAPEGTAATVHNFEVSLVLEYCDWGSLRTALNAGAFFAADNSLNYAAILDTAADIARAMMHLHKNQVLHSDLKVRNVLLKSDASGRGCVAKVADFGLAVRMDCCDTHVSAFQGTMSHMAPEALLHGRISKAGDMYSFGITLWELFTGGQAYQGIPRALVGHKVAVVGLRPTLPPFTPPDFKKLIEQCWAQDPDKRPSFEEVLAKLVAMRTALGSAPTPPLQRYKLTPKSQQLDVKNKEPHVDSAKALEAAQAHGLMQMGSYYISSSASTVMCPPAGDDGSTYASNQTGTYGSYIQFRSMGTIGTGQLEPISDTEAEELEEDIRRSLEQQQQQQQASTATSSAETAAAAAGPEGPDIEQGKAP